MYYNRIDSKIEYFDLDKMKILDKEEHDYNNRIVIAEFGDIVYFIETKIQTAFMAESTVYLWTWSSKGDENGIDKAAKQAGITKISHVDSYTKSYFWGIVVKQTTKVYGE
jgi:hypothetical protein